MSFFAVSKIDLLILNDLSGEYLAKHGKFFLSYFPNQ